MDRVQLVLLGLPILLFCSDVVTLFAPQPPAAPKPHRHPQPAAGAFQPGDSSPDAADSAQLAEAQVDGPGSGTTVELKFCASCSYKGNAMTMKRMLDTSFPGIHVVLENYPPPFPKRALGKMVPFVQVGAIATLMAGDQIFPRFGMVPPPWYYSLRANRFGTMASVWMFGNFAQSLLQSSGAFEVYCNGQLVFSKLSEQRFPSEFELRELIGNRLSDSQIGKNLEKDLVLDDDVESTHADLSVSTDRTN
ncbi:selT-like protein isoform X1 [Triticum urartu]|uniref:SelT-like protein n=2 Tax=Triticum urartu TaxID=4572 RepID=A0A8R7PWG2_TRIUA|nr:selT-like protein isoform X1 [Triticum urartu]